MLKLSENAILLPNLGFNLFISLFDVFLFPFIINCLSEAGSVYLYFFAYVAKFLREHVKISHK